MRHDDPIEHAAVQAANLVKNHQLAKSSSEAGWSAFLSIRSCKAAEAGKTVVAVPPAFTAPACSGWGVLVQQALSVRWHEGPDCGASLHRDHTGTTPLP